MEPQRTLSEGGGPKPVACEFVSSRRINSYQKLRIVLWLHQHAGTDVSIPDLAQALYIGDLSRLERILADLAQVGLVQVASGVCTIRETPETENCLCCLETMVSRPMTREELLRQIATCDGRDDCCQQGHDGR